MPPLNGADYVVNMAMECGMRGLTWQELNAWKQATVTRLSSWEAGAIMRMASSYNAACFEFDQKPAASPWVSGSLNREQVAQDVRNALRRRR